MERYVADASVLVQALVEDAYTAAALRLLDTLQPPPRAEIYVPEFCLCECGNVLWKRVSFHHLEVADARGILSDLLKLPLKYAKAGPLMTRAFGIGVEHSLAVYDSLYIALAERLDCPLITVDARQARAAEAAGITLKAITDFVPSA